MPARRDAACGRSSLEIRASEGGADRDRRAHAALRGERPHDAAARRVERIDGPVLAADEQASAGDGRLRPRRRRVRKSERPLEMEPRHLLRGQARLLAPAENACCRSSGPQPFHSGPAARIARGRRPRRLQLPIVLPDNAARSLRPVRNSAIARRSLAAQREPLILHRAGRQRVDDRLRRSPAQHVGRRRARVVSVVTAAAVGGEQRGARRGGSAIGRLRRDWPRKEASQEERGEGGRCREA